MRCIDDVLDETKDLISKQFISERVERFEPIFEGCHKTFFWTNENINGCLNLENIHSSGNALCVMASGDHFLNLITKGILNIDTFDANKLSEFFALGLKISMILKYSYEECLNVIKKIGVHDTYGDEICDVILDLLPMMEKDYRLFWQEVLDFYKKEQSFFHARFNLIHLLFIGFECISDVYRNNSYLLNKDNYNKLRNNLGNSNVRFYPINLEEMLLINNKYDIIMLSNILDYYSSYWGENWSYEKLLELEQKLDNITSNNGVIFLHYLLGFFADNGKISFDYSIFQNSVVKRSDLGNEEIHFIKRNDTTSWDDGVILKRVK